MNPYKILGIRKGASQSEIKNAYFSLIKQHPPEKDPQGFKRIRGAYEELKTKKKRKEADLVTFNEPPPELVETVNKYLKKNPDELDRKYEVIFRIALGYLKRGWFFTDLYTGYIREDIHVTANVRRGD
jgi:curved DNA-binding protein CbpA